MINRHAGCLLGLAAGDALGTTIEFSPRDTKPHLTEMVGGGVFHLTPGCFTDDTSMALAMASSIVHLSRFEPANIMNRFVQWRDYGEYSPAGNCFDIGNTTNTALERYLATNNPYAGETAPSNGGNGALMRLAPIPMFAWRDPESLQDLAAASSMLTHGAPESLDACRLYAVMIAEALSGRNKDDILRTRDWNGETKVQDIAAGTYKSKSRDAIRSSGYVIHTLEAALWSIHRTNSFEDAIILAVNLGEDADTVGAVTGQLAGALYGVDNIPPRWLDTLQWKDRLLEVSRQLYALSINPKLPALKL